MLVRVGIVLSVLAGFVAILMIELVRVTMRGRREE
jgi:hypothetical protein